VTLDAYCLVHARSRLRQAPWWKVRALPTRVTLLGGSVTSEPATSEALLAESQLNAYAGLEWPRFRGQLSAGLSDPAVGLSGRATEAEGPEAVLARVSP